MTNKTTEKSKVEENNINYVKPEILDLGSVAPIYGATCSATGGNATDGCANGGTAGGTGCSVGNFAGESGCNNGGDTGPT